MASKKSEDERPEAKQPETKRPEPANNSRAEKPQPEEQQETLLLLGKAVDRKSLETKAKEELIDIILELNSKLVKTTDQLNLNAALLPFKMDAEVEQYIRVPAISAEKQSDLSDPVWRIVLISPHPDQKPLGLEVHAPIIIGRKEGNVTPHVDLNKYAAEESGVSRRHALLRPTDTGLFLTDLRSMNGTLLNSVKLEPGVAQELKNGDTISFGLLHFKLRVVSQPKTTAA